VDTDITLLQKAVVARPVLLQRAVVARPALLQRAVVARPALLQKAVVARPAHAKIRKVPLIFSQQAKFTPMKI